MLLALWDQRSFIFESPRPSNTLFNKCMETSLRQIFTLGLAFLAPVGLGLFLMSYFCYSCLLACLSWAWVIVTWTVYRSAFRDPNVFLFKSLSAVWHLYVLWVSGKAACTMTLANGFQVIKQTGLRRAIFSGSHESLGLGTPRKMFPHHCKGTTEGYKGVKICCVLITYNNFIMLRYLSTKN